MDDILLEKLRWRYATKVFDPEKKIPENEWAALEEALILTPSSYGMQPWKFLVVTNQELKESLIPAAYKQRQVADCSHLLVIAIPKEIGKDDVEKLAMATAEARGQEPATLDFFRKMVIGDIIEGPRSKDPIGWAKLQSYIALGNFMTSAALLGIDCCPMEGFVPQMFDEALGLAEKGYTASVLCPAGYRSDSDKYATAPKVRYEREDLIEYFD
ncbi:MAG: NAD(P)H-dependent oxidoreductase [Verrucomicrobiales bacterium]|nr:NAD(P)H-dependent oxidoreductase [Verrucomicrobiales bacterium]